MTALKSLTLTTLLFLSFLVVFAGPQANDTEMQIKPLKVKPAFASTVYQKPLTAAEVTSSESVKVHSEKEKTARLNQSDTRKPGILLLIFSVAGVLLFPAVIEFAASESIKKSLFSRG
ncbi:MAG: hypothetical protein SF052_23075 [Bacteroidia bacterium]|nr:hypothetical protein [Bacteroidia bacterium]